MMLSGCPTNAAKVWDATNMSLDEIGENYRQCVLSVPEKIGANYEICHSVGLPNWIHLMTNEHLTIGSYLDDSKAPACYVEFDEQIKCFEEMTNALKKNAPHAYPPKLAALRDYQSAISDFVRKKITVGEFNTKLLTITNTDVYESNLRHKRFYKELVEREAIETAEWKRNWREAAATFRQIQNNIDNRFEPMEPVDTRPWAQRQCKWINGRKFCPE
jgi:hypothetical protein